MPWRRPEAHLACTLLCIFRDRFNNGPSRRSAHWFSRAHQPRKQPSSKTTNMIDLTNMSNDSVRLLCQILPVCFAVFLLANASITAVATMRILEGRMNSFWRACLVILIFMTTEWLVNFAAINIDVRRSEASVCLTAAFAFGFLIGFTLYKVRSQSRARVTAQVVR